VEVKMKVKDERKFSPDSGELEGTIVTGDSPASVDAHKVSIATEVTTRKRRRFTKAYKLGILKEIDSVSKRGDVGAILRREGLYSSNIAKWREQLAAGKLHKRKNDKNLKKIAELSKKNRRLQKELNRSKIIIEAQKKMFQLLEEME